MRDNDDWHGWTGRHGKLDCGSAKGHRVRPCRPSKRPLPSHARHHDCPPLTILGRACRAEWRDMSNGRRGEARVNPDFDCDRLVFLYATVAPGQCIPRSYSLIISYSGCHTRGSWRLTQCPLVSSSAYMDLVDDEGGCEGRRRESCETGDRDLA